MLTKTFRQTIALFMVVLLSSSISACGGSSSQSKVKSSTPISNRNSAPTQLQNGEYPVQQASYEDTTGEYTIFLLNASPSMVRTSDLKMAALTEEERNQGKSSYLKVTGDEASLHLSPDFRIEYVHAVTETRNDPQTGQQETVVVRRESNFWAPFAGALAGQAIGSMLFSPSYYVPPPYQSGSVMTGYGGSGSTYRSAVQSYRQQHKEPPAAVKNRQANLRTTGRIGSPSSTTRTNRSTGSRSTGSGYGSNTLRRSGDSSREKIRKPSSRRSFGSSGSSRRSGGSRRRR